MPKNRILATGHYRVRCFDSNGVLKWEDGFDNIVVDEGLNHLLEVALANETAAVTTWYVGLLADAQSPAAGWTAASLTGGVIFTDYSEGVLQTWVPESVAAKSVANSVTTADFSITGGAGTVGGAFLISTSAKATPAGTLYSAGNFSSSKAVDTGDTLKVTVTFTQADA